MSGAVLLRRILSPSFGHRKWRLGEGQQWEVQQEGQKLLLDSLAAIALQQEGPPQAELNAWKRSGSPVLGHSGFPQPGGGGWEGEGPSAHHDLLNPDTVTVPQFPFS